MRFCLEIFVSGDFFRVFRIRSVRVVSFLDFFFFLGKRESRDSLLVSVEAIQRLISHSWFSDRSFQTIEEKKIQRFLLPLLAAFSSACQLDWLISTDSIRHFSLLSFQNFSSSNFLSRFLSIQTDFLFSRFSHLNAIRFSTAFPENIIFFYIFHFKSFPVFIVPTLLLLVFTWKKEYAEFFSPLKAIHHQWSRPFVFFFYHIYYDDSL